MKYGYIQDNASLKEKSGKKGKDFSSLHASSLVSPLLLHHLHPGILLVVFEVNDDS